MCEVRNGFWTCRDAMKLAGDRVHGTVNVGRHVISAFGYMKSHRKPYQKAGNEQHPLSDTWKAENTNEASIRLVTPWCRHEFTIMRWIKALDAREKVQA